MEEAHRLDKVLLKIEIKNITELNNTILACKPFVTEKYFRATCNGNQRANQQAGWKKRKVERLKGDVCRIVECRKDQTRMK